MSCAVGFRLVSSKVPRNVSVASQLKSRWCLRGLHTRKELPYAVEGGLGEFLPPAALRAVAVDWQEGLLQRLNDEVRGTPDENESIVQTIINAAPHRERTLTFNYASLALNNSYFLEQLKPPPPEPFVTHQAEIPPDFANMLRFQHGSIAQLKSAFSAAVTGMFTSGWVWFVTDANGNTGIIPTFGPGTLLIRSRTYMGHSKQLELGPTLGQYDQGNPYLTSEKGERQGEGLYDVNPNEPPFDDEGHGTDIPPAQSPTAQTPPPGVSPQSPVSGVGGASTPPAPSKILPRFMHSSTSVRSPRELESMIPVSLYAGDPDARTAPLGKTEMLHLGEVLYPLFCVSVHEHAWMSAGYGVWGKEEWMKKFWTVLDWAKVSESYNAVYNPNT